MDARKWGRQKIMWCFMKALGCIVKLLKRKKTAEEEKIPYQLAVRRGGGTDAGEMHLSGEGVPSMVLGVPSRYIHSHNSVIDLSDYRAMVDLSVALIKRLGAEQVAKFTDFL